ncbi:Acetyl-CoA acetyltransferase, partial [Modestobacter sp. DSM 44400]|uniref:transposase n=9 Tax=Modestobacter sp. DSM 44400 TaxID=1550230 RepID=UPI000898B56F
MQYTDVALPLGCAWSSPFAKWQGTLAEVPSLKLAVAVTARALADRGLDPTAFDGVVLGCTVPQKDIFYGAPTLAARLGATGLSGPMIAQACATSVAALHSAAGAVAAGAGPQLVVATDRVSNGPTLSWPAPSSMGGAPVTSHWVLDSFARDPWADAGMLAAAEVVVGEMGATRDELDDLTALRWEQYAASLADDRAFQRRYQVPVQIPSRKGVLTLDADEGIRPRTRDGIGALPPAAAGALHTFASQTHPADGCAGAVVTTAERARAMSGEGIVRILGVGFARVAPRACLPKIGGLVGDAGRMLRTDEIPDELWELIQPVLPAGGHQGRPWNDHRLTLEAIIWRYRTGSPWRDLPDHFGAWQSVWERHRRWSDDGTYVRMFAAVRAAAPERDEQLRNLLSVDS